MSYTALALLGGVLGLDAVSCVQAMISRPIVAGPLAGWLLGDPVSGLYAGALLEVLSLRQLPVGATRAWDPGPAAVAAAAAASAAAGPVALLVAVGFGVLVGWVGSWSVHAMRRLTGRFAALGERPLSPRQLAARHLSAVALDFVRAAALTLIAVWIGVRIARGQAFASGGGLASIILLAAAGVALGADLGVLARGRAVAAAFAIGFATSLVFSLWLS